MDLFFNVSSAVEAAILENLELPLAMLRFTEHRDHGPKVAGQTALAARWPANISLLYG
jgi:hypothetical protein